LPVAEKYIWPLPELSAAILEQCRIAKSITGGVRRRRRPPRSGPEGAPRVRSPLPAAKRPVKKATVRGLGKLLDQEWWPLEVAVVWVATGDVALTTAAFGLVIERRSPVSKCPSLATWLMTYEGRATLYEATPGAIYRKRIRKNWKPGDRNGLHPLDNAMDETAAILKGQLHSKRGRARDTRRLARGIQRNDEVTWIPTRAWSGVNLVDHRKWGMIILGEDHQKTGHLGRHRSFGGAVQSARRRPGSTDDRAAQAILG
jgi:hypothetical protein